MSTSGYTTPQTDNTAGQKRTKNLVIVLLAIGLAGSLGYLIFDQNKTSQLIGQNQTQISQISNERSTIQKSFDESLVRLDSMSGVSAQMKSKLTGANLQITKKKAEIRRILNKQNASAAELAQAKDLIAQLNDKIGSMEQDVARLTQDNQALNQDNAELTQEKTSLVSDLQTTTVAKQDLEKKVDIASTLNASNIAITPFDVKRNGKDKMTSVAKRVNKLVISFDVTNRIAQSGMTDVYVCITGPDGKNMVAPASGSGTFTTREEGDQSYTAKLAVDFQMTQKKNVEFAFAPGTNFQQGSYTIRIYQNGYKIGEGTRELKKGGLFS